MGVRVRGWVCEWVRESVSEASELVGVCVLCVHAFVSAPNTRSNAHARHAREFLGVGAPALRAEPPPAPLLARPVVARFRPCRGRAPSHAARRKPRRDLPKQSREKILNQAEGEGDETLTTQKKGWHYECQGGTH